MNEPKPISLPAVEPPAPAALEQVATRAFEHHARQSRAPLARLWRLWERRAELTVLAVVALGYVAWALLRVLGS
ncbi:MAG: hypothetical protein K1X89_16305 [Myxococcaceae bacterium]|nr:hypothetical protein [Myxococcaceae bacterium]